MVELNKEIREQNMQNTELMNSSEEYLNKKNEILERDNQDFKEKLQGMVNLSRQKEQDNSKYSNIISEVLNFNLSWLTIIILPTGLKLGNAIQI